MTAAQLEFMNAQLLDRNKRILSLEEDIVKLKTEAHHLRKENAGLRTLIDELTRAASLRPSL